MNNIKLGTIFLVAATLFGGVVVQAESDRQVQPVKIEPKATTEIRPAPANIPQTPALTHSKQGYQMVTDVLDGFGGESESDNYRISVNSGGQPSAIGISQSNTYMVQAGYVLASHFKRGDTNADGIINSADVVFLIDYLFKGGPDPCPPEAGDASHDCVINSADVVYLINYLFKGGPPPAC